MPAHVADLALHVDRNGRLVLDDVERRREVLPLLTPLHRVEEPLADDAAKPDRLHPVALLAGEHPAPLRFVPEPQFADERLGDDGVLGDVGDQIPRPVRPDLRDAPVAPHHRDLQRVGPGMLLDVVHPDHRNLELRHCHVLPLVNEKAGP